MSLLSRFWRGLRDERSADTAENGAAAVDPDPAFIEAADDPSIGRFVVNRQAVLNGDMEVVGYEFAQVGDPVSSGHEDERDRVLLTYVCGEDGRNLVGERIAFVSIGQKFLFDDGVDALAGTRTTLLLRKSPLDNGIALIRRISDLRQAGVAVGFADGRAVVENHLLANAASAAFFSIAETLLPDLMQHSKMLATRHPALCLGIRGLETQEEFDACRRMSFSYFHGPFIRRREEWSPVQVNESALRICDLLARMRKGAELGELAEQIKHDPMISYRILRFANSAAVGATRDITSISDATLIIGRQALYRWLVLLLCVAGPASPGHQALLEDALARGRLMELLAGPENTPSARQVLFLTGIFSLLDVMLKVPMDALLAQMTLPPELRDALLERSGPCVPLLRLAEACESGNQALLMQLCDALRIDLGALNQSLAAAGAWARESAQGIQA